MSLLLRDEVHEFWINSSMSCRAYLSMVTM